MIIQTDKKLDSESNENQNKNQNTNMIKSSLIHSNKIGGSLLKRTTIRIREEALGPHDELNYCIKIMEKTNRNVNEIHAVANYLKALDELIKFFKTVSDNFEELLVTISCMLRSEYHQRNKLIFRTGDKSGKFYIILKGSVSILKANAIKCEMTDEEFVYYIITLRRYNETELLLNCIKENRFVFNFDDEFEIWLKNPEKPFDKTSKFYRRFSNRPEIISYLLEVMKELLQFRETDNIISWVEYVERVKIVRFPSKSSSSEQKQFFIYQYEKILEFRSGKSFGEIALVSASQKRTATIITNEDTYFGTLDKNSFDISLKQVKEKQKKQGIDFFLSTQIFHHFNRKLFENRMFHFFIFRNIVRNERIIQQGDSIQYVYFIKKGDYEVTTRYSLSEINEFYENFGEKKKNTILEEFKEQEKMNHDPKYRKLLTSKMNIKISIAKTGDILGLDDMLFKEKSAFSVDCVTATGEVFYIDRAAFNFILEQNSELKINLEKLVRAKVQYLVDRLKAIKVSKVSVFEFQNCLSAQTDRVKSSSNQRVQYLKDTLTPRKENLGSGDFKIKLTKNAISLNMDNPSYRMNTKKDFQTTVEEEKQMSLTLRLAKKYDSQKNKPIVIPFNKSNTKAVKVIKDSIDSFESEDVNVHNDNFDELDTNNKRTILKKIVFNCNEKKLSNNEETKSKRTGSEIRSKRKFENLKKEGNQDFSQTFHNFFNKKSKAIEMKKEKIKSFSRKDIHVIDFNNLIENDAKTERNFKSILSQNTSMVSYLDKNLLTSRNEKRLAPAKMIKIKQTASKKKRYKSSVSMKVEEKLINHMKIVKISKPGL